MEFLSDAGAKKKKKGLKGFQFRTLICRVYDVMEVKGLTSSSSVPANHALSFKHVLFMKARINRQ